jgi:hypothetical protein
MSNGMPDVGAMQGQAYLLPQYSAMGQTRPFGPGEYFMNQGGLWSNEITTTVTDPRLNNGQPSVIPTLWIVNGVPTRVSEDQATELAIKSGLTFQSFPNQQQAETFANSRESNWQNIKPQMSGSVAPLWTKAATIPTASLPRQPTATLPSAMTDPYSARVGATQ